MNAPVPARRRFDPRFEVVEELLIRAAIRIELPPSLHALAVDRYEAVRNHIERDGSPLKDRVRLFYPQGSMAIRATIRSRKRADGYDIDIVAEVVLPHWTPPGGVLDTPLRRHQRREGLPLLRQGQAPEPLRDC